MAKGDIRKKHRANSMGAQWWRKLSLPRRGKKDTLLAPTPEGLSSSLATRLEKRGSRLRKAVEAPRVSRSKGLAIADWNSERCLARVSVTRGNTLASMGFFECGVHWIYPEEAAYLVDRAQMDLRVDGIPASLQRAWGLMTEGRNAITLDDYCAFSHLRRVGYVVRRFGIDVVDENALNQEAEMDAAGTTHGKNGRRKKSRAKKAPLNDVAEDVPEGDAVPETVLENPRPQDDVISPANPSPPTNTQNQNGCGALLRAERAQARATPPALSPSFSVWRVGAYRRRITHRPLFHLLVARYEDPPPRHEEVEALLAICTGKTRLRVALIDRGVVVLVDMANNATPLSKRYTGRVDAVGNSEAAPLAPNPNAVVGSAVADVAGAQLPAAGSIGDVKPVIASGFGNGLTADAASADRSLGVAHADRNGLYAGPSTTADVVETVIPSEASGPAFGSLPVGFLEAHPRVPSESIAGPSSEVPGHGPPGTSIPPHPGGVARGRPDRPLVNMRIVEAVRRAILTLKPSAGMASVSFSSVVEHLTQSQGEPSASTHERFSEEDVRAALCELAFQEDIVLSSGASPTVYPTAMRSI